MTFTCEGESGVEGVKRNQTLQTVSKFFHAFLRTGGRGSLNSRGENVERGSLWKLGSDLFQNA